MAYHKSLLNIVTKEVEFIKPSKPTPNSPVLSLSSIDNRTDLNFPLHSVQFYRPINPNKPEQDPVKVYKGALSKALIYYYPLAGRLVKHSDGKFRVNCNDEGVPFLEAIANCDLSCVNYLDGDVCDAEFAKQLVFDLPSHDQNGCQYPLVFKVTKFLCGGFTIATGFSHTVADGQGMSQVLRAIVELARGESEPSVKPVWERERLVGSITKQQQPFPIDEASAAVSPFLPTKDLVLACFKVDNESIKRLKMSFIKECENERFSKFELLAAYLWRSRTRALKLNNDGKTLLVITVNVRPYLIHPPLPEGYYGNAIVERLIVSTVNELNEKSLSEVVKLIRESRKMSISNDYIKNSINMYETKQDFFDFDVDGMGAITNLSEINHLGFLEMDFGGNELVNMLPAPCDILSTPGVCLFLPPSKLDPSMKGGFRIFVTLPSAAMVKFKEEMEALTFRYAVVKRIKSQL